MTKHQKIALVVLLPALGVMAYSGNQLYQSERVYAEGNSAYAQLASQVRQTPSPGASPSTSQLGIPPLTLDFDALREVNPDAVAWLYGPGTEIDYPVLQARDYSYYLHHLPDGTVNANGSLFIDYNNPADFSGQLTVIYGHNMKSGRMFGGLDEYKSQSYFDEHPYMYLYTQQGNFRVDLIYGSVIAAGEWRDRAFMYQENLDSLLSYAAANTTFSSDVTYQQDDKLVALSTCSYEFNDARYVVLGVLKGENK
jgi:sortase B